MDNTKEQDLSEIEELAKEAGLLEDTARGWAWNFADTPMLTKFAELIRQRDSGQGESVAEVRCQDGEVFGYIPKARHRIVIPLGTKLYTKPPQPKTVKDALEKVKLFVCEIGIADSKTAQIMEFINEEFMLNA